MEVYKIENLSFKYPAGKYPALSDITIKIKDGEFITLMGKSGCGKTTLLRLLKSSLAPSGELSGRIFFKGQDLNDISQREQTEKIGFVMQNPDNQIVTDKVWHELAFGLESMGEDNAKIRAKVAETASFFGIEHWFYKDVSELSGGQKQLLNLASVMVMEPSVIILDEPTSQLDPIASGEFLNILKKINRELGTTVIISEHRLEDFMPISHRVIVMDEGKIIAEGLPTEVAQILKLKDHDMCLSLPTPIRVFNGVENDLVCPVTVREGRNWLYEYGKENKINNDLIEKKKEYTGEEVIIEIKDAYFRYKKDLPEVIKGLDLEIKKGEFFSVVGGNGTGKTTTLSIISGLIAPQRGEVLIKGEKISRIKNFYGNVLGVLPQSPEALFTKKTVYLDLLDMIDDKAVPREEKDKRIKEIAILCDIQKVLDQHPYDLSGGEKQRVALSKVLLKTPEILILDEPTKGMDAHFKEIFANILKDLKEKGTTIVMVSHDIEFVAEYSDRCALFFDGEITSVDGARDFFKDKSFYTTAANRMAREKLPDAVTAEDIIIACGGKIKKPSPKKEPDYKISEPVKEVKKLSSKRIVMGCLFVLLFLATELLSGLGALKRFDRIVIMAIAILEIMGALICFFPQREVGISITKRKRLSKKAFITTFLMVILILATIYIGMKFLGSRRYYITSLLIIFETIIPFLLLFEKRKPRARELCLISVLCAIAVCGRTAFYMLPQFKPMVALVIIAGICLGGETGFLMGAMTAFLSNFFFGQGPWTPWHMLSLGLVGLISGIAFHSGLFKKTKISLTLFGFFITLIIYGGIMNVSTVLLSQTNPTFKMFIIAFVSGLPFDLIHSFSTSFFLWFLLEPMVEKIERIKLKFNLISTK